ncbi:MAG: exopolysaccharide biosynthesis polyprenyl glycosylphosphotransferase [Nitrospiraceae bacterium]
MNLSQSISQVEEFEEVEGLGSGLREIRRRGIIVLGSGQLAANIAAHLQKSSNLRHQFIGWLGAEHNHGSATRNFKHLKEILAQGGVSSVVVALAERRGMFPTEELLSCRKKGIRVEDGVVFYEKLSGKIPLAGLNPSSLIFSDGFRRLRFTMICKRLVDIVVSCIGFVVSLPIWIVLAIAIKLDSQGPLLFRQKRLGQDEKRFQLLKFRTMRWEPYSGGDSRWAHEKDTRLTRVGRVIRQWRLDELPQLWNVLKGDLSFVGPRPDVPALRDTLKGGVPYYSLRTAIKPGITGWAQVRYHYVSSVREGIERHEYDLYYIKNMSLLLDFRIIIETVRIVALGRGAR